MTVVDTVMEKSEQIAAIVQEEMSLAIVGHVDHGKSTLLGRLLADTDSLPEGKLASVKKYCENNSKPFEFAFLLDALKTEQAQGITLDTARCFFQTEKRRYIILDTPGHLEFLKNMVTGASRAEAAMLIIDAAEGIQENSYRHGYLLSLLGVRQVAVVINKMDLVDDKQAAFAQIKKTYGEFLHSVHIDPVEWIPVSAQQGDNVVNRSAEMSWYYGPTVIECIDNFKKEAAKEKRPFRFPVQDVYKFTAQGDTRRIVAGTIETGSVSVGDEVVFLPSGHTSTIKSIEQFNVPVQQKVSAGQAVGFTLTDELFIQSGEIMCKQRETQPKVSAQFHANVFWLGKAGLKVGKRYRIKLCTSKQTAFVEAIVSTFDATELERDSSAETIEVPQNHVAECIIRTLQPIAFDLTADNDATSRFVIVDGYEIAGGGIITQTLNQGQGEGKFNVEFQPELKAFSSAKVVEGPQLVSLLYHYEPELQQELEPVLTELNQSGKLGYVLDLANIGDKDEDVMLKTQEVINHLLNAGVIVFVSAPIAYEVLLKHLLSPFKQFSSSVLEVKEENGYSLQGQQEQTADLLSLLTYETA